MHKIFNDLKKKIFKLRVKILILGVVFSVLGTVYSLYGWVELPKFDSNEYLLFSVMKTQGVLAQRACSDPVEVKVRLHKIMEASELLVVFTEYPSANENTHNIAVIIHGMGKEMVDRYSVGPPSVIYCKLKFDNIIEATTKIMEVLGDRRPTDGII